MKRRNVETSKRRNGLAYIALAVVYAIMGAAVPDRPRDPWVFRCVLDKNPRMVVIALHEDLWVAYDAMTCSLYKVWQDGVKFDGAVYTTVHGPQPTSVGGALFEGPAAPVWMVHSAEGGLPKSVQADPQWRGYRIDDGSVWLHYEFPSHGLAERYEESIEAILHDGKPIGIHRRFRQVGGSRGVAGSYWMTIKLAQGPQTALSQINYVHSLGDGKVNVPRNDPNFEPKLMASGDFEIRMYFQRDAEGD